MVLNRNLNTSVIAAFTLEEKIAKLQNFPNQGFSSIYFIIFSTGCFIEIIRLGF